MKLSKEIYLSNFIGERLLAGYSFAELYNNYSKTEILYHCAEIRSSPVRIINKSFNSVVNIGVDYGIVSKEIKPKSNELSVLVFDPLQAKVLHNSGFKTIDAVELNYDLLICLDLDGLSIVREKNKLEILKDNLKHCDFALIGTSSNLGIKAVANADFCTISDLSLNQYLSIFTDLGFSTKTYYPYPNHIITNEIFSDQYPIKSSGIYNSNLGLNSEVLNIVDENQLLNSLYEKGISNQLSNSYLFYLERL